MFGRKKKNEEVDDTIRLTAENNSDSDLEIFYSKRKTVRELVAPLGVNPNPLDYMVIDDNGTPLYTMCFYIDKLPTRARFADTFAPLFNFVGITSSVFINPLTGGSSTRQLEKRVNVLDSERIAAEKAGDRNRYRKIQTKLNDTESFAQDVESGDNQLYEVSFLFTLQSVELDGLRLLASDLQNTAREKGIELAACYSVHPEAFLSGYPTNRIFKAKYGIVTSNVIKKHIFDKGSLCTIFNHTSSSFSHKGGILAGRNMANGQPVTFDIYDESHNGYGLIICGKTGTGKSATVKMYMSRYIDFGYRIRSIDFEARGTMGEYALMAQAVGGVNFQIKPNSKHIINLFEIDAEEEFDEITGKEYPTLNLTQKKVDVCNLIMIMIKNGNTIEKFDDVITITRIVTDTIAELYDELGIYDGDVDSLYEVGNTRIGGKLGAGKVKKKLPTITAFFKHILIKQKKNDVRIYDKPYQLIVDSMKDYVKELYYCPNCISFFTREAYSKLNINNKKCPHCGKIVSEIHGVRSYFDGQSTVKANQDTTHINIDISQLTESEKMIALLIALNFMQENYIKKNSVNPKKTKKLITMIDELHKAFPYEEARRFISDVYRTARKRNVSPWVATQALADFKGYKETEGIIKNTTSLLLLKQDFQDREFIKESTPLTDSQVEQVLNLGGDPNDESQKNSRRGEVCLIDNGRVAFIKVDYLMDSESKIVETDVNKIQSMYKGRQAISDVS